MHKRTGSLFNPIPSKNDLTVMGRRFHPEKFHSQIVFDITGGEKTFATMMLATFPNQGRFIRTGQDDLSLRTDDIEGARARPPSSKTRDTTLNISDIEGARPAPPFDPERTPVDIMSVSDIQGSAPRIHRNLPHSHRHTNPLMPEYQLPSKEPIPPLEVKFVYDGTNFDDIPGVHPRSLKSTKPPKDVLKLSDIPGARPRPRVRYAERPPKDILAVTDINNDGKWRTARRIDPLNPVYRIYGGELEDDFGIAESNYRNRQDGRDLSLTTSDIDGASTTPPPKGRPLKTRSELEEEERRPAPPLMLPSMYKQTEELERQRAMNDLRAERIWRFEHRHLQKRETGDKAQDLIRSQRAANLTLPRAHREIAKIEL
jgi:hypothetical protein